jgi:RNA exonuclease 4
MAVFRIHRKDWEKGQRPRTDIKKSKSSNSKNTAASVDGADDSDSDDEDEDEKDSDNNKKIYPGGGRKGISSGLSVIVKRKGESGRDQNTRHSSAGKATKSNWWKEL